MRSVRTDGLGTVFGVSWVILLSARQFWPRAARVPAMIRSQ
jgi:hypothetical protein